MWNNAPSPSGLDRGSDSDLFIPEGLLDFYPEDNSCVDSFMDLYILVEKLIKITQFTRNETEDWGWDPLSFCFSTTAKLISDLKVIKIKCKSEMRSALGKLLPLPDTALDKVLKSILNGDSLEEYKFEEVPAEDSRKINMMYGRLTLIFIILRDADGGANVFSLENTNVKIGALTGFWVTTRMEEEEGSYLAGDDEEDA